MSEKSYYLRIQFRNKKDANSAYNSLSGPNDKISVADLVDILNPEASLDMKDELSVFSDSVFHVSVKGTIVRLYFNTSELEAETIVDIIVEKLNTMNVASIYKMEDNEDLGVYHVSRYIREKYQDVYYTGNASMYVKSYNDIFENESPEQAMDNIIELHKKGKIKSKYNYETMVEMLKDDNIDLVKWENLHFMEMDNVNTKTSMGELALNVALRNKHYMYLLGILFKYSGYLANPNLKDADGNTAFDIAEELGLDDALNKLEEYREGAAERKAFDDEVRYLTRAEGDEERFYQLGYTAKAAFEVGEIELAKTYAEEFSKLMPKFEESWYYGEAMHTLNIVLGRLSLKEGMVEEAKAYLMESAKTHGSEDLESYGPDLSLSMDLLEQGEYDIVVRYINRCKPFWGTKKHQLSSWLKLLKEGKKPDFTKI